MDHDSAGTTDTWTQRNPGRGGRLFLAWTGFGLGYRPREFGKALGAEAVNVYHERWLGLRLPTPARYLFQAARTLARLLATRPRVVLVQTPPFVLTAVVWAYAAVFRARFVTDNHSAGLMDPHWRRFHAIDRFLAKRAAANIAHNESNLELLRRWGAANPILILSPALRRHELLDPAVPLPGDLEQALGSGRPRVLMVCQFGYDDCYDEVFEAARRMAEARFFVTGDWCRIGLDPASVPANVVLTGFLPRPVFMRLMDACDVVLSLTRRPDALFWAIRECLALEKPFVATGTPVNRDVFGDYGVFTDNSPADLEARIEEALARRDELVPPMAGYIEADKRRWRRDIEALETLLQACPKETRAALPR